MRKFRLAVAAALGLGFSLPEIGRAQALTEDTVASGLKEVDAAPDIGLGVKPDDKISVYALPVPIVDPTVGNGLAVGALATFSVDPADELSPRASLAMGAGYTDSRAGLPARS